MRKLYDALVADGSYTLSFEEFTKQFNNEEGSKKLHSALEKDGDYTKPYEDFITQFEVDIKPVKTTTVATDATAVEGTASNTDSSLENGSSVSQRPEGEFYIDGDKLEYSDPKNIIPKNFKLPAPILDDQQSVNLGQSGDSEYGDKNELKIQKNLYQQRSKDIMNATGEFSFLKDKSVKIRKQVLDRENVPNFGKIQAVEADPTVQENIIDIVPFQERQKRMRSKFIPDPTIVNALENATKNIDVSKFESEEQIQEVIAKDAQKLIFENPLIKDERANINLARLDDFKKIADDLAKKYDLNDKDQHLKANEELNEQVNEVILKDLVNSKIFKEIAGSVDASLNDVFSRKGKEFTRNNDWWLRTLDKYRPEDADNNNIPFDAALFNVLEGAGKSVTQLRLAIKETGTTFDKGDLNDQENAIKSLNEKISELQSQQEFVLNEKFQGIGGKELKANELGSKVFKEIFEVDGKKVSEAVFNEYSNLQFQLDEKMKLMDPLVKKYEKGLSKITGDVKDIEDLRKYLNAYNSAGGEGLLPDSIAGWAGVVAEQSINLGLAGAAAVTKSPYVAALAATSMFTQEYGDMYYGAAVKALEEELGRKATQEEIAKALESGKYSDAGVAAAGAGIATAFEYYGLKATGKGLKARGKFVTSIGKVFQKNGKYAFTVNRAALKQLGINTASVVVTAKEAGLVEGGTETLQKLTTQTAQGSQMADARGMRGLDGGSVFSEINVADALKEGKVGFWVGAGLGFSSATVRQAKQEVFQTARALAMNFDLGSFGQSFRDAEKWFKGVESKYNEAYENRTQDKKGNWSYTEEEYQNDKESLSDIRNAGIKLPKYFSESSKSDTFETLIELESISRRLKKAKEQGTEGLAEDLKLEQEVLQKKLGRIAITEKFTQKAMKAAKGAEIAQGIDIYETKDEALAAVEEWNAANPNDKISLEGSDGAIAESGKRVVIDLQTAKEIGNVNVAAHEILHRVLVKTFAPIDTGKVDAKGNKIYTQSKAAIQVASALRTELNKIDTSILEKGSSLFKKMEAYKNEPKSVQAEELLTLLGDVLKVEGVQLQETVVDKIGNSIRRVLQNVGFSKIKFNSGKDVVNFIKDFNYDTKTGKFSKAIKVATSEGIVLGEDIKAMKNARFKYEKSGKKPKGKNSKIINDEYARQLKDPNVSEGEKMGIAYDFVLANKGLLYPKLGFDLTKDLDQAAIDMALVNQIIGKGLTKGRQQGFFDKYIFAGQKGGTEVMTFTGARIQARREEIYRNAGFNPEDMQLTKIDDAEAKQIAIEETVVAPKIKGTGKARVPVAFEEFTVATPQFIKEIGNIIKPILNTTNDPDIKAENIIEALDEVAAKEITNLLYKKLGKISTQKNPVSGKVEYIMPENYIQFFDTQSDLFSRAIPLEDIKKVYTRSTPKLFKVTKIGRENIKNVNKFTGKVTYPGRDIFKIEAAGKGAIGSFFLANNRNSVTRQNTLFKIMGKGLASPSVYNYLAEPRNIKSITGKPKEQVAIALENEKLLVAAVELDRKAFEDRSFDNFKNSKVIRDLPINKKAVWFSRYAEFVEDIKMYGSNEAAVEISMNKVYGNRENSSFSVKQWDGLVVDMKDIVNRYNEITEDYKAAETKLEVPLDVYISTEIAGITERDDIRAMLKLDKKALDFNDGFQLQSYSNSIVALGQHILRKFNGNEQKALSFMVNKVSQALTSMGKTARAEFIFNNKGQLVKNPKYVADKGLERFEVPFAPKYSNSLRYGIYDTQEKFMKIVLEAMVTNKQDLTIKKSGRGTSIFYKGKALKETKVTQSSAGKKDVLNGKLNLKARAKESKQDGDAFIEVLDWYKNKANNSKSTISLNDAGMMLMGMNSDMNTILRTAAGLESIIDGKFPSKNASDWTWEHNIPARVVVIFAADYMNNGKTTKEKMEQLMEDYSVAMIPKTMDDIIGKFNKDTMVTGYQIGDNVNKRYYNINTFGKFPFSMKNIRTGKIIPISRNQPIAYKAVEKAKVYNESKFKNSKITFPKNATNEDVLNKMESLDVKAQEARANSKNSKILNEEFNDIIEKATGIGKEKKYGKTKARAVGASKGRFDLLGIPPSAQDFVGLTRYFVGKGKQGDKAIAWIKENFLDPFARANIDISNARVALANDFKNLKNILNISPKDLNKKIPGEPYTVGGAVRVYTWVQQGMTIPGLSKADQAILVDFVGADTNLTSFANQLITINKENGYPKPSDSWLAGAIKTDLLAGINNVSRPQYLKEWQNNVNEVFNEENLNKLEAAFGNGYRDALENILGRMKTGSNRGALGDSLTGRFVDWMNGAVGAIMFFNMRSAVLQTISAVNFVNFTDNNIFKAAKAFANQPRYWNDVIELMNSDYLVERRNGLKINVNEADIAEIAAESKNKAKAFINKLLKLGFLPTQIADSFAIASGGATFYRNRVNSLLEKGMTLKEAEAQAFLDFREIAEESQQSSRPDRISKQQAGPLGRIILAFANTPAQYARLMQKAASDLKNRRGDDKTNISKIIYYGAIQNVIFNALQQALFAMAFGDDADDEKKQQKYVSITNGMADSLLRGIGFHGAAISTLKNVIMKLADGAKAQDAAIEMLDISPPVSSKIGKLRSAGRTWDWNKKEMKQKGWSLDNPAWLAMGQVISAGTNIPLDRGIKKLQNLKDASDSENEEWMRVANALGWQKWELEWEKNKRKGNGGFGGLNFGKNFGGLKL